jgi:uncharacterized Zn-binding protein involved in type VI secretion
MKSRAVTRLGDLCTGHGRYPPRPNIEASENVFINGLGAHREGDNWAGHDHGGVLAHGSPTVFVNGKALARIGDPVSCGSVSAQGSSNVFSG